MRYAWIALLAAAAAADDVILVSGGEITNCRVIYEGPDEVVIDRGGTQMVFRRSQVLRIIRGEVVEAPPREAAVPSAPAAPAAPAEPPPEEAPPRRAREDPRIKGLIDELASGDEDVRDEARSALAALGKGARPALAGALTDNRYWVRFSTARMFVQLRPREATKAMIEALYASVPERGRSPSWNGPYIRALRDALRATTGMNFGLNPRSQTQGRALEEWVGWWEKNYAGLPRQIGEEELDADAEDYEEKLTEARKLELQKKAYPRPPTWQPATSGEQ